MTGSARGTKIESRPRKLSTSFYDDMPEKAPREGWHLGNFRILQRLQRYKCNKKSGHATLVLENLGPVVSSVLHETNISEEIINEVILYNS